LLEDIEHGAGAARTLERAIDELTASGARVATVTATVTNIDLATRHVTLRRPDGSDILVIASEQVRNLPQLRVGDTVTMQFVDTLTLELKKGGTGAPASRSDALRESRPALGERPGGITTRETTILADVVAVDPPTQTVSLRGPGGRTVILPLKDPRVQKNPAYLSVILLSRVLTRLGAVDPITPNVIEGLFAADLAYLQQLYNEINRVDEGRGTVSCPQCQHTFAAEPVLAGGF